MIYNPNDEVSLHRIINTPRRGISKTALMQANTCCKEMHLPLFKVMVQARKYERIRKESAFNMEMLAGIINSFQQFFANGLLGEVCKELLDEVGYIRFLESQSGEPKVRERRVMECSGIIAYCPDVF